MIIEIYEKIQNLASELALADFNSIQNLQRSHYIKYGEKQQLFTNFNSEHLNNLKKLSAHYINAKILEKDYKKIHEKAKELALQDFVKIQNLQRSHYIPFEEKLKIVFNARKNHLNSLFNAMLSQVTKDSKKEETITENAPRFEIELIPIEIIKKIKTKSLLEITKQLNGCYTSGYADACLVMMRRLLEALIILNFLKNDDKELILKKDGSDLYLRLEILIKELLKYKKITLTSRTSKFIFKAKEFGDVSAHNPLTCLHTKDIDNIHVQYRTLIGELLNNL